MNPIHIDRTFDHTLTKRAQSTHKGDYGRVLVIAGSKTMMGAAILSAKAAYKSGAGIVKVVTEKDYAGSIFANLPEAIVGTYERYSYAIDETRDISGDIAWADAILFGPGMGQDAYTKKLLKTVIEQGRVPLVVDADGLNVLSDTPHLLDNYKGPLVITPHVGEMARLLHCEGEMVLHNRKTLAQQFSIDHDVTVCLKSHETIVAHADTLYINHYGNPGMATAGSGDVLAGIVVSLLGQGYSEEIATAKAVAIHSLAGDAAKCAVGEHSLMASDIIHFIPKALALKEVPDTSKPFF